MPGPATPATQPRQQLLQNSTVASSRIASQEDSVEVQQQLIAVQQSGASMQIRQQLPLSHVHGAAYQPTFAVQGLTYKQPHQGLAYPYSWLPMAPPQNSTYTSLGPSQISTDTSMAPPPVSTYTSMDPPPVSTYTSMAPPPVSTYTSMAPPPVSTYTSMAPPPVNTYTSMVPVQPNQKFIDSPSGTSSSQKDASSVPSMDDIVETATKVNKTRRSKRPKADCPCGCKLSFVIGSSQFNQHLRDHHLIVSNKAISSMVNMHRLRKGRKNDEDGLEDATNQDVLSCSICYKECLNPQAARECAASHPDGEEIKLVCMLGCLDKKTKEPVSFKNKVTFRKHMREQHGKVARLADKKITCSGSYKCTFCPKTFVSSGNRGRHMRKDHAELLPTSTVVRSVVTSTVTSSVIASHEVGSEVQQEIIVAQQVGSEVQQQLMVAQQVGSEMQQQVMASQQGVSEMQQQIIAAPKQGTVNPMQPVFSPPFEKIASPEQFNIFTNLPSTTITTASTLNVSNCSSLTWTNPIAEVSCAVETGCKDLDNLMSQPLPQSQESYIDSSDGLLSSQSQ